MSRTKDLWMEQHEAAIDRYVTDEDDKATFVANLQKLGFDADDIRRELDMAEAERAHFAAHEAGVSYFKSITRSKP